MKTRNTTRERKKAYESFEKQEALEMLFRAFVNLHAATEAPLIRQDERDMLVQGIDHLNVHPGMRSR